MIALALFSLAVIVIRIWRRQFTRAEWALLAVLAVSYAVVVGQSCFEGGRLHLRFPEARYTIQSTLLLYPWGIYGIITWCKSRKWANRGLTMAMMAFALLAVVMLIKSKIPGSRRNAHVRACDWAVERIRADWDGPQMDKDFCFYVQEYHRPNRPIVRAHTARLPYLLGGRLSSEDMIGAVDRPDYWFDDINREDPPTKGYHKIDSYRCGKYQFELYRRNQDKKR